jgi:Phage integrase family
MSYRFSVLAQVVINFVMRVPPRGGFVQALQHVPSDQLPEPLVLTSSGEAAGLPFPVHVHMLRHSTGYALAARGMDTRRLQHFLGHASITNTVRYTAMSPEPFRDIWRS